jgi:hypothetical protein
MGRELPEVFLQAELPGDVQPWLVAWLEQSLAMRCHPIFQMRKGYEVIEIIPLSDPGEVDEVVKAQVLRQLRER